MDASINEDSSVTDLSQHDLPSVNDVVSIPSDGVRLIHHNIQGLLSKMPEITQWLHICDSSPTILCCSETWLRSNDSVGLFPGYDFYCSPDHFRIDGTGRASRLPGSCIFVSGALMSDHPTICTEIEDSCQSLNVSCCFITCKFHRLAVVSIYRSPSTCPDAGLQELSTLLDKLCPCVKNIILAGDFNIDLHNDSSITKRYVSLLSDYGLSQYILQPTRVSPQSSTLIDHVICTNDISVLNSLQAVGLSDHRVQLVDFDVLSLQQESRVMWIRSFRRCRWVELKDSLSSAPWHLMSLFDDIDDQWNFFHCTLQQCLDEFIPLKRVRSKKSRRPTPWFTDAIQKKIKDKNHAKRVFERTGSLDDRLVFRKLKNDLKHTIRQAKLNFLQSALSQSKSNPSKAAYMWSCVNSVIGRFKAHKLISEEISLDSVNCYFSSAALTPNHQSAQSFELPRSEQFDNNDVFSFSDVTTSTVLSHLKSLDTRKSAGPDNLSARFLKDIAHEIAAPLTSLFNFSLQHGTFPAAWKQSNITPIYKGGPVDDPSNYRPISVVSVIAKILEKIVSVQLSGYLETNHLFHPHQGAYRSGKSTEDILQSAVDHIVNCLDNKQTVCAAFLDLRKAFDSLDHCLLLHRLQDLGVGTVVLQWFQNYLSDRRHRVKRSNTFSDWVEMQGGIPQGSALGPLLFLVYMNSLPSQVTQGLLLQYADDTTLICSGSTSDIVALLLYPYNYLTFSPG